MGLYDFWLDIRDKCLTSPAFHKFALDFPFTRPIVRKRQSELFDFVSGFVYSQILFACVKLGVLHYDRVKSGGATLAELCEFTGLGPDETYRLARGAASMRILQERRGRFRLGDLGAALSQNKGACAMILHHAALYQDMADPVAMLAEGRKATNLSTYWDYALSNDPKAASELEVAAYSDLMSASQQDVSEEIIASFDFGQFDKMLDIGGGQGTFATRVSEAFPELEIGVFDLPSVVERGHLRQAEGETGGRIRFHGGSFFTDKLPTGSDLMTLVRILHDHDDAPAQKIINSAYEALGAGGTLLVAEPMSTGGHAARISDAYFNFYLYAMGSGRPRKPVELVKMLKNAGFAYAEQKSTRSPFTCSIIVAQK
ncbi:MAG: methyltransferase [Rhizobiaceae bacterium]|nr:methyltransferase [Rhizobiaceae bacterium]